MKASGKNTAVSTRVMPTIAPPTCVIAFIDASRGDRPSSAIRRSTFSTTTIASSTRMPIASTIANMLIMFTEKPSSFITANVPSRHTGTTIAGIRV